MLDLRTEKTTGKFDCVSKHYPEDTYTQIRLRNHNSVSEPQRTSIDTSTAWKFPLPGTVNYNDIFEWNSESASDLAMSTVDAALTGITKSMPKVGELISSAKSIISGAVGAAKLSGYAARVAYNPNKLLLFGGAPHRQFNLNFELVAENQNQARQMAQGIRALRLNASPEFTNGAMFFQYPYYFELKVVVRGKVILHRPCIAIREIATNLSGQGGVMAYHKDGKPVHYTLDLSCYDVIIETNKEEQTRAWLGEGNNATNIEYDGSGQQEWFGSLAQEGLRELANNVLNLFTSK